MADEPKKPQEGAKEAKLAELDKKISQLCEERAKLMRESS